MAVPEELESQYYTAQGFDPEHSRIVRSHYLQYVDGRELLVELGCGRGEFLEVAKDKVGQVIGVDVDPEMVKQAQAAGFEAVHSDVIEYLGTTDHRPDAVFLAHLIEHLPVTDAYAMLEQAAAVIPPGGVIIIVTPNPACLANLTNDFWSDPTHQRLYTLDLLRFLLEQTGFEVVAAEGNPLDVPGPPPTLLTPTRIEQAWGGADTTIEPRALVEYTDQAGMDGVLDELHRLRDAVESLVNWQKNLDERLIALRHFTEATATSHDDALHFLFGPNEIYAVGRRT